MLVPRHPKPVGRRRAVAEMTVAARQVAAIEPGHLLVLPATPERAVEAPAPRASEESPPVSPDRHDPPF
jgi:hypothetical protein